jgi:hypothetical protein
MCWVERDGEDVQVHMVRHFKAEEILLDPAAWAAVGNVEGWPEEYPCDACGGSGRCPDAPETCAFCEGNGSNGALDYAANMHRFLDALIRQQQEV